MLLRRPSLGVGSLNSSPTTWAFSHEVSVAQAHPGEAPPDQPPPLGLIALSHSREVVYPRAPL